MSLSPTLQTETSQTENQEFCFHCSLPVPAEEDIVAEIEGEPQHFCCMGC
ncbi:MAG: heavy metal translocating P-type ATPase metal-binding domain-containing protein, partial [Candidatus Thiodiazotropha sp.]